MKNQIFALVVSLAITFVMISCGSKTSTQQTEPSSTEQMTVDTIGSSKSVSTHYQCPMKCEGEKMYDKPGQCPVCNMDIVKVDGAHKHHEHDSSNEEH